MTAASPAAGFSLRVENIRIELCEDRVLIQITAPHFCAGAVLSDERVSRPAPILAWLRGQSLDQVRAHCRRRRWLLTIEHDDGSWEFDP